MKLQLTLLFCFILFSANAQESMKGNWRLDPINGMGTLYGSKRGKPYQFVNISPSFAKFSGPKTLIGIDSRYSYHHRTLRGDDFNWQYIELAPFVRKYFGNSAFKPFIGAQYRLSFSGYETFKDTRLENFDLDMEIGLGYFSSKTISFDLAFDFPIIYNSFFGFIVPPDFSPYAPVRVHAFGAWDFQYVPNISFNTNIYIPFSSKAVRAILNPLAYQAKGNRVLDLSLRASPRVINNVDNERTRSYFGNFAAKYQYFLSDTWLAGAQFNLNYSKSYISISSGNIHLQRFITLPKRPIQLLAALQIDYQRGNIYNPATGQVATTKSVANKLTLGAQYRMTNKLLKINFGTSLKSGKVIETDEQHLSLVNNIQFEYEQFWTERASFFANTNIIPNDKNLGLDFNTIAVVPSSVWQFGMGYRVYFMN